jgi:hypothetical protein
MNVKFLFTSSFFCVYYWMFAWFVLFVCFMLDLWIFVTSLINVRAGVVVFDLACWFSGMWFGDLGSEDDYPKRGIVSGTYASVSLQCDSEIATSFPFSDERIHIHIYAHIELKFEWALWILRERGMRVRFFLRNLVVKKLFGCSVIGTWRCSSSSSAASA